MHEQSIVESLLALALEKAEKANAKRIVRIYLVVGEFSGVVEEAVDFYFGFLTKNTIAADASLFYNRVPAQVRCRNCDRIFTPKKLNFRCPDCNEQQVEIIAGRELYIDSMEVE
jgi:hydrogenase nickel incorporation protein HypA/HybF